MAVSGFEGFEKRLELHFSGDDPAPKRGLRRLDFFAIEQVLHAVQCTVVSAVGNQYFDSYVLSESSLFVYPAKIIIKTCGTTQLLKSVRPLVDYALTMGLTLSGCRYTRGSFIFPKAQPYPHTTFKDEVLYLEDSLPNNLVYRKASVMNGRSRYKWHVFSASDHLDPHADDSYTMEICMTELDPVLAKKFFGRSGTEMTDITGIRDINRNALICDYGFDPCGYSMNGLDGIRYSTIHVTPEDGFSYASFECDGSVYDDRDEFFRVLQKVVKIFRPAELSISTTCAATTGHDVWKGVAKAIGMKVRGRAADEFPAMGSVVFQTFATRRK